MASITYSRIPAGDTELLTEVMGYHFRVIQSGAMQMELLHIDNAEVLETLSRGRPLMAHYDQAISNFNECLQHGAVICAWENDFRLVGYAAYSNANGRALNITHRPDDSVAVVNFFRMGEKKDAAGAKGLAVALLDDLREHGQHRRLAYLTGITSEAHEWDLERVLKPTALGFEDYGRFRVAGLNAADLSLGIVRRPSNLKGPSHLDPKWKPNAT